MAKTLALTSLRRFYPEKSLWQESSSTWPSGPTGLLPSLTTSPQARTARPTGSCHERSPACRAATVERQPGAVAHIPARMKMLEAAEKSF
ncbi:MAG: hypothetical protein WCP70_12830 [Methanothrix sp.]